MTESSKTQEILFQCKLVLDGLEDLLTRDSKNYENSQDIFDLYIKTKDKVNSLETLEGRGKRIYKDISEKSLNLSYDLQGLHKENTYFSLLINKEDFDSLYSVCKTVGFIITDPFENGNFRMLLTNGIQLDGYIIKSHRYTVINKL